MFIKKVFPIDTDIAVYRQLKPKNLKNIPKIYEVLENSRGKYVIEEYLSGKSADKILAEQGKISPDTVISWAASLCDTLKQLHNCNPAIIHRDIKPSNIMVMPDNTVKLIDFDISRNYKTKSSKDTRIIGTDYYISPEQHGSGQTDNRSDIFSMGKLMIALLTGKQLPLKEAASCLGRLSVIVEKCCELDPARRYQDVSQLKRALLLSKYRFIKPSVLIVTLLLFGFAAYKLMPQTSFGNNDLTNYESEAMITHQPSDGINSVHTSEPEPTPFESLEIEPNNNSLPLIDDNKADSINTAEPSEEAASNSNIEETQDAPVNAAQAIEFPEIQPTLEPINTVEPSAEPTLVLQTQTSPKPVKYTSVSVKGKVIGITADNKEIVSCTDEGVFVTSISNNSAKQAVSFSPYLVWGPMTANDKGLSKIVVRFNTGKDLGIYDISSGQCLGILAKTNHNVFTFSDDGKLLVTVGAYDSKGNISATVFDTETRAVLNEFILPDSVSQITIHPDNKEIALFYFGGTCQIRNLETFDLIYTIEHDKFNNTNSVYGLCYSDNGRLLLLTDYDNTYVIDADDGYRVVNAVPNPPGYHNPAPIFAGSDRFILGNLLYDLNDYSHVEFEKEGKNKYFSLTNDLTYLYSFENWNLGDNNCVIYKWNIEEY